MIDETNREQLKAELKQELLGELDSKVEEEVEEELEERRAKQILGTAKGYIIAVAATIMALGQFSEAVTLIEDGMDWVRSKFTNEVEYEMIANIHVGNTMDYVVDIMGNPQVSRTINDNITANYFYNEKFLLTVYFGEDRVSAYTVAALREDFQPTVTTIDDNPWRLQEAAYQTFPANPDMYMIDYSKVTSYYLESLNNGRIGLYYNTYLGSIVLTSETTTSALLVELYRKVSCRT